MSSHSIENNESAVVHHEPNYREPVLVFLGLVLLTISTVGLAGITSNAGLAVIIALSIASVKGFLVLWYFMHVKYESVLFKVFISVTFLTIITIIALLFTDYMYRSL